MTRRPAHFPRAYWHSIARRDREFAVGVWKEEGGPEPFWWARFLGFFEWQG